jgi:hypothetical protein
VLRTSLELVHVVAPLPAFGRWQEHADRACTETARRARAELVLLVRSLRSDVHTGIRVQIGDVASILADAATPHGRCRPLLVLGRNPARPHEPEPGAIAYRVLMEAAAPVLVYLPTD